MWTLGSGRGGASSWILANQVGSLDWIPNSHFSLAQHQPLRVSRKHNYKWKLYVSTILYALQIKSKQKNLSNWNKREITKNISIQEHHLDFQRT